MTLCSFLILFLLLQVNDEILNLSIGCCQPRKKRVRFTVIYPSIIGLFIIAPSTCSPFTTYLQRATRSWRVSATIAIRLTRPFWSNRSFHFFTKWLSPCQRTQSHPSSIAFFLNDFLPALLIPCSRLIVPLENGQGVMPKNEENFFAFPNRSQSGTSHARHLAISGPIDLNCFSFLTVSCVLSRLFGFFEFFSSFTHRLISAVLAVSLKTTCKALYFGLYLKRSLERRPRNRNGWCHNSLG